MIMNKILLFFILSLILISDSTLSYAGWLIYHKPEFKGKVIDAETKEPIEGAVVVAIYEKHTLISGPGGGYSSVIKVKETLTDKKGEFHFPPYTTLIQPNSIEDTVEFIIYKPGYGSYPGREIYPFNYVGPEYTFSKELSSKEEIQKGIFIIHGIVELPKLKTRYERLRAIPATPTDYRSKELPLLYKAMNEENKRFGLGEEK
jgi:hypothetical protein